MFAFLLDVELHVKDLWLNVIIINDWDLDIYCVVGVTQSHAVSGVGACILLPLILDTMGRAITGVGVQ